MFTRLRTRTQIKKRKKKERIKTFVDQFQPYMFNDYDVSFVKPDHDDCQFSSCNENNSKKSFFLKAIRVRTLCNIIQSVTLSPSLSLLQFDEIDRYYNPHTLT